MANLLDSLKEYITPEIISKAGSMLGESESGVSKAVSAIFPTLLSGLVNKSGDSGVMGSVIDLVTKGNSLDGGLLSNVAGLLGSDSSSSSLGSTLLSTLFGNKLSSVTDVISNVAGVKSSSVTSLLGMAAPLLLGHLGKLGVSASGLTSLLSSQKDSILSAAPAGLGSVLGLSSNLKSTNSSSNDNSSGGGLPKWLLPLLLLVGGALLLFYLMKSCNSKKVDADVTEVVDSLKMEGDTISAELDTLKVAVSETITDASASLGNFFKTKLANGVELNIPENGIENKVITWMNDKTKMVDKTTWFNFDRLLFETGKSTLKPESQEQLKNISEVLKAYPNMEIKLGGYTDNVGNPAANLKLSGERAKAVLGELTKLGINAKRLASEGYGDQFPVGSNDTEEGRSQNRRIAVRITKK